MVSTPPSCGWWRHISRLFRVSGLVCIDPAPESATRYYGAAHGTQTRADSLEGCSAIATPMLRLSPTRIALAPLGAAFTGCGLFRKEAYDYEQQSSACGEERPKAFFALDLIKNIRFCTPYLVFTRFFSWDNAYKDFHCLKFGSAFGATASPHRNSVFSFSRFIHRSVLPANGAHSSCVFGA